MSEEAVLREDNQGLCTLTLNRPEKLNALNNAVFERLGEFITALESEAEAIGCVVLRGAGRSFCAGADLRGFAASRALPPTFKGRVIERLSTLPQPVVAQIHGHCMTGGLELALAADIIVAGESARFADTHGKWGLVGGWGMTQRLPRRIGRAQAMRMSMTSRIVEADEALRIGLADVVVPDERLDEEVRGLAEAILANSWHTNRETKRLIRVTDGMSLQEGLAYEHYRYPGRAPDAKQRIESFKK